jgi:hypothetical protein
VCPEVGSLVVEVPNPTRKRDERAVSLLGQRTGIFDARSGVVVLTAGPFSDPFGEFVGNALAIVHRADGVNELLVTGSLGFGNGFLSRCYRCLPQRVIVVIFVGRKPGLDCACWPISRLFGSAVPNGLDSG